VSLDYFKHETAIVDAGAEIGKGSKVWHWVHICGGAKIGEGCVFGQNVFVGNRVRLGKNVKVQNNVSIYDNVFIEDDVFCGPSMVFTNVINPRSEFVRKDEYLDTHVRDHQKCSSPRFDGRRAGETNRLDESLRRPRRSASS
jgi:UDP-2-acetamido-3-amino-2,3-dideoxy-glucuronate N-acetyltransferase